MIIPCCSPAELTPPLHLRPPIISPVCDAIDSVAAPKMPGELFTNQPEESERKMSGETGCQVATCFEANISGCLPPER